MSVETCITVQLVHGGYVLHTPATEDGLGSKMEVFTSTPKLVKAFRGAIEKYTLVPKKADSVEADE